ncbi:MAG: DUF6261 family protein, partial [Tannerellaceae bacterium]|nr:DUF6261 family protein [Tannerellaceae bacterium]
MKTVNNFITLVTKLRNGEHFEFYEENIESITPHIASLGVLLKPWTAFTNLFKQEDDIYKQSLKAAETTYVAEANQVRRNAFLVIKQSVETAALKNNPAEKEAVRKVSFVLDNFRHIPAAAMVEMSALIYNMIQDLRLPACAPHVETLGLTADVNALEAANETFKAVYRERETSIGEAGRLGNMLHIRPLTDKAFANFTEALEASFTMAKLNGQTAEAATLEALISGINDTIKQYQTIYARRHPGSKGKGKGGDTPEAPGDPGDSGDSGDNIPFLSVASQEAVGQSGNETMHITLADAEAFARALYPAALGGVLQVRSSVAGVEPEEAGFAITDFLTEAGAPAGEEKPVGLLASVPAGKTLNPLDGADPCEA